MSKALARAVSHVRRYAIGDPGAPETQEAGFHQALHENPAETTTALAYADWLEEQGQDEAAHVIRMYVEQNGTGAELTPYAGGHPDKFHIHGGRMHVNQGGHWMIDLSKRSPSLHPSYSNSGLQWNVVLGSNEPGSGAEALGTRLARGLLDNGAVAHGGSYWQPEFMGYRGAYTEPENQIPYPPPEEPTEPADPVVTPNEIDHNAPSRNHPPSTNFARAVSHVRRYARSSEQIRPFLNAIKQSTPKFSSYQEAGRARRIHAQALADFLEDENDPRAALVSHELNVGKDPRPPHPPNFSHVLDPDYGYEFQEIKGDKDNVHVGWFPHSPELSHGFIGTVPVEHARRIADLIDDEFARSHVHLYLDRVKPREPEQPEQFARTVSHVRRYARPGEVGAHEQEAFDKPENALSWLTLADHMDDAGELGSGIVREFGNRVQSGQHEFGHRGSTGLFADRSRGQDDWAGQEERAFHTFPHNQVGTGQYNEVLSVSHPMISIHTLHPDFDHPDYANIQSDLAKGLPRVVVSYHGPRAKEFHNEPLSGYSPVGPAHRGVIRVPVTPENVERIAATMGEDGELLRRTVARRFGPKKGRFARAASRVRRYSHNAFLANAKKEPTDANNRAVYADWIQENDPDSATPETLDFLRTHQGPAWVKHVNGQIQAGEGVDRVRMEQQFHNRLTGNGESMMGQIHGDVHSGPGGHFFVEGEGGTFNVVEYNPEAGEFHYPSTGGYGHPKPEVAHAAAEFLSNTVPMGRRHYAAYRAPAGGMIARGTAYKGGEMVPNMEGAFMNPPASKFNKEKLSAARANWVKRKKVKAVKTPPFDPGPPPSGGMPIGMSRAIRNARRNGLVRYSHDAFQNAIRKNPEDSNARAVYADWLEENEPDSAEPPNEPFYPGTLNFLRSHQGPAWVGVGPNGKVHAGKIWTMAEIRDTMKTAGIHWFDRGTMRFFSTRVHGKPIHGPGGVYFVTSDQSPNNPRRFTVRHFQPAYSNFSPRIGSFEFMGHPDMASAVAVARRLAKGESVDRNNMNQPNNPEHMSRAISHVRKYAAGQSNLRMLLKAARQNPHEETLHGEVADALEEEHPGHPVAGLIREQYGLGGEPKKGNLWQDEFYNSWDGTFPYAARLGRHGPFNLYLAHEGDESSRTFGPREQRNANARWLLHAVSRFPETRDSGYTFEFPHSEAHRIPQMFPAARRHISLDIDTDPESPYHPDNDQLAHDAERNREAREFNERMDEEEQNRQ